MIWGRLYNDIEKGNVKIEEILSNKGSKEGTRWLGMLDREGKKRAEMCESIADNG